MFIWDLIFMNKLIYILLLSVVLVGFVCCSNGEGDETCDSAVPVSTDETETAESEYRETDQTESESEQTAENETEAIETEPIIELPSILDLLKIAVQPVGSTMYVWGGGWSEEDTGSGIEAVSLGVSPRWAEFAAEQTSDYDHKTTRYQIHDGLDCSGYIGWVIYNTIKPENEHDGFVMTSTKMASEFAKLGMGDYIPAENVTEWKAGDIMSMNGHAWIAVGECEDGSVLFLHSSPPGVMFNGTSLQDGGKSQAVILAERIMSEHYPEWYYRFPDCDRSYTYLTESSAMRWNRETLSDSEKLYFMTADDIVQAIFE